MGSYRITMTYPYGSVEEIEEVDEDFLTLKKAQESAEHLLGQVEYNAQFHKGGASVKPFAIIKEYNDNEVKIVYDSRN